ncbi:probable 1,4-beta-D-glucan cellobiohydrolase B [Micropterus dolomieu]|uniref:probable 1,4-beta-D-glucan cellobiohydrolase B n=1 Tax=Micropterus dolomieu TaxID=147949 RepID=UPI001E8DC500|nr:probable 1,4-beta-D-glucan cellobiohydrolase B [Micropterus dolomieu]
MTQQPRGLSHGDSTSDRLPKESRTRPQHPQGPGLAMAAGSPPRAAWACDIPRQEHTSHESPQPRCSVGMEKQRVGTDYQTWSLLLRQDFQVVKGADTTTAAPTTTTTAAPTTTTTAKPTTTTTAKPTTNNGCGGRNNNGSALLLPLALAVCVLYGWS